MAPRLDPRAVPLFDAIARLDSPDPPEAEATPPAETVPVALPAPDPTPSAPAPDLPERAQPAAWGRVSEWGRPTRRHIVLTGGAGLVLTALVAGLLTRPTDTAPSPTATAAGALDLIHPAAITSPPDPAAGSRSRAAPRPPAPRVAFTRPTRAPRPARRARRVAGSAAGEFAP